MNTQAASKYILVNSYVTNGDYFDNLVTTLKGKLAIDTRVDRVSYTLAEEHRAIDIIGADSMEEIVSIMESEQTRSDEETIRKSLTQDVRREVVKLHTTVKAMPKAIPTAEKIQLRYIEVPGIFLEEYFDWRTKTIFKNVSSRDEITGFLAYHSFISTHPGVTFFVEYTGSYEELMVGFSSDEYKDIIEQANKFIVGGNKNLYTRPYERIYISENLLAELPAAAGA